MNQNRNIDLLKKIPFLGCLFYKNILNGEFKFWKDYINYYPSCFDFVKSFYLWFFRLVAILYIFQGAIVLCEPQANKDIKYGLVALVNIGGGLLIHDTTSKSLKSLKKGKKFDG
ncbi:MAG: hypothetical protein AB4062_21500 [Crocosphaera sp.]